ncbi:MAG: site-2 protease family protein [Phycisphaerae bacterium]
MFGKSIHLFTLFGFEVRIDLSWLIILVIVVWSLSAGVFPQQYPTDEFPQLGSWAYFGMGLAAAVGLFGSIVFHEMWHSLIARRFGLPMEGITLFLFGGVAQMDEEPPSPAAEFYMAIAGPIASVVVAGVCLGLWQWGQAAGWPVAVRGVLMWLGIINTALVVFNLIPGFPLDGGRVLRSILWKVWGDLRRATRAASRVGAGFGMVLIGLGIVELLIGGNVIGAVWWILIGMFIRGAAKQGYQQVILRQLLHGDPVSKYMNPDPVTVSADTSLRQLVEDYVYHYHHKMYPVVNDGELVGCVTTRDVAEIPRGEWDDQLVEYIASDCSEQNTISPDADAMDALTQMSGSKASRLMVTSDGKIEGIISLKDLTQLLALRLELDQGEAPASVNLPEVPQSETSQ